MLKTDEKYSNINLVYTSKNNTLYTATDTQSGQVVVLKTISESIFETNEYERILNEYRILSKIKSEFVPKAFDYVKLGDQYFLIMEYCKGITLKEYIENNELSIREFLFIACQIVNALVDIHKAGIIHKDINPSNIIYDNVARKVSVIDFGLSTEFSYEKSLDLEQMASVGTLFYISPEQTGRMNHMIDFRTDFYSLGVTFYKMLCKCYPFESESPMQIIYMHLAKLPPCVVDVNPNVPAVLSKIIYKLMAKMPENRYLKAEGILFDLEKCVESLSTNGIIEDFELGLGDYFDRFEISPKLYGRENEIFRLIEAYNGTLKGNQTLVAIAGYSGIGKTSLVGELHKPIANSNGIFISGKFDQYHVNMPYYAISQAIEQFCDFILSESEKTIEVWKLRITNALGNDGKLLVDRIPKLALIAEEQQELPILTQLEERTRFKNVLLNLLSIIATPERPVAMFIDDIHLADVGSLEIIEEIMSNDKINGLLIVVCYRDNEVNENHPLLLSIQKLLNKNKDVQRIHLSGLELGSAVKMLSDVFHCEKESIIELTQVTYGKTGGNPFYMKQFLRLCYVRGDIFFDGEIKNWRWHIDRIKVCEAEENVVDFLVRNMDQIPLPTQKLLSLGACIGQSFDADILFELSGEKIENIIQDLEKAVSLEIVYPINSKKSVKKEKEFHFAHDRFQQTFYIVLPESERIKIHYRIAVYYEKKRLDQSDHNKNQFDIADNYSKSFNFIDSEAEKRRVSEILLRAAKNACLVSAFDTAIHYLEQIIDCFIEQCTDETFKFSVYSEYHYALSCLAKYEESDKVYEILKDMASEPIQLADSCGQQVVCLSNRSMYKDAFMLGTGLLDKLGVHFPEEDLYQTIDHEINIFYSVLKSRNNIGIEGMSESFDPKEIAIGKILNNIIPSGFFYNPLHSFWAVIINAQRILQNGYTLDGLEAYGTLTVLLVGIRNDYELGYISAKKALQIAEKINHKETMYRLYHVFSVFNIHWFENIKDGIPYARESFRGNVTVGDFEFACFSYFTTQQAVLETCKNIDELEAEVEAALAFADKYGNEHGRGSYISYRQLVSAVKGNTKFYGSFDDDIFSEIDHISKISENGMAQCYFSILRSLSAVIYSDFDTAFELTEKITPMIPAITGFYPVVLHNFLNSIAICKQIEKNESSILNEKLMDKLDANQEWLSARAKDAPMNFSHLYQCIEAERVAIKGGAMDLVSVYEKAMDEAKQNNRQYHYAIICDLAAHRFFKLNAPKTAINFLKEAYLAYDEWGAKGKTKQLKQKYKDQFEFIVEQEKRNALFYKNDQKTSSHSSTVSIDYESLVRASQALSKETKFDDIMNTLINILLENSGAQNICYLTKNKSKYLIQAEGHIDGNGKIMLSINERLAGSDIVPIKIINYVSRTKESIILDNATISDYYGNDEYIASKLCKSVMCIPIINKGDVKGILYLENNLIEGAFDKRRIEGLNIIAAQFAISLENAYLFNNLQRLVDERTHDLREEISVRKSAEKRLEQMANHDSLTNLPNRRMFHNLLEDSIESARLNNQLLAVLFVDLDGFKAINDKYGHDKGDIVLLTTAKRLLSTLRSCDTVSRMGGDEFVLILENLKEIEEIRLISSRLITNVGIPIELDESGTKATVTSSIGISIFNNDGITAEELISNADKAMYIAKKNGKNQFVFYSDQSE